jgi:hypothetical protein
MAVPIRVTCALDEDTARLLEEMKDELKISQSELVRKAIRFLKEYREMAGDKTLKKLGIYLDMLSSGEHVILDMDHWLLFLKLIETSPQKYVFWQNNEEIAKSHAEQFTTKANSLENVFERLEACNFFKTIKLSDREFTLVLLSESAKEFVKRFLLTLLNSMGFDVRIKEDFAKLRVSVTNTESWRLK